MSFEYLNGDGNIALILFVISLFYFPSSSCAPSIFSPCRIFFAHFSVSQKLLIPLPSSSAPLFPTLPPHTCHPAPPVPYPSFHPRFN